MSRRRQIDLGFAVAIATELALLGGVMILAAKEDFGRLVLLVLLVEVPLIVMIAVTAELWDNR